METIRPKMRKWEEGGGGGGGGKTGEDPWWDIPVTVAERIEVYKILIFLSAGSSSVLSRQLCLLSGGPA